MRRSVSAWRAPVSQCSHGKGDGHRETSRQHEALVNRVQEIYLHIDMDAMDPEVAPGVVDHPVPGGLSLSQMLETIRAVRVRIRLRAACLATYTPEHDIDGKTLQVGLRILDALAE